MDILLYSVLMLVTMILGGCVMFFLLAFSKHYKSLQEYDLVCWKNLSRCPSFWGVLVSMLLGIIGVILLIVFS